MTSENHAHKNGSLILHETFAEPRTITYIFQYRNYTNFDQLLESNHVRGRKTDECSRRQAGTQKGTQQLQQTRDHIQMRPVQ